MSQLMNRKYGSCCLGFLSSNPLMGSQQVDCYFGYWHVSNFQLGSTNACAASRCGIRGFVEENLPPATDPICSAKNANCATTIFIFQNFQESTFLVQYKLCVCVVGRIGCWKDSKLKNIGDLHIRYAPTLDSLLILLIHTNSYANFT